jgi:hypothetical protein
MLVLDGSDWSSSISLSLDAISYFIFIAGGDKYWLMIGKQFFGNNLSDIMMVGGIDFR